MDFLKKLFGGKDKVVVTDYRSFWNWFTENADAFFGIVKTQDDVEEKFLDKVIPVLKQINEQFFCLVGMENENTAEMVVTVDGDIKSIVFAEEIIASAPSLKNWKFTALKPAIGFDMSINMDGFEFDKNNISFVNNEDANYPDEIDLTFVHKDFSEENRRSIGNGCLMFLDNALGELNTVMLIDNFSIDAAPPEKDKLIPISKLSDFLQWREKEFVEKYKGVRYDTENDNYTSMEGHDKNDLPIIAIINQSLMEWDAKPSHPWMMTIEIKYDGKNNNGLPTPDVYALMSEFEQQLEKQLTDADGYLNLGRETYNSTRTSYFACKEFRKASKAASELIKRYTGRLDIDYNIYKDKYWRTMNKFQL